MVEFLKQRTRSNRLRKKNGEGRKKTTSWKIEEKEETMAQMRKEGQYLSVGLHMKIAPDLHKSKTHLVKMLSGGKGQDPLRDCEKKKKKNPKL